MDGTAKRGKFDHAGDPVGQVLAWLWRSDSDLAVENLATYISELRWHAPVRIRHGAKEHGMVWPDIEPVSLDDVLGALSPAMPADFESREYQQLCELARIEVPKWLDGPAD